jgi:GMP synthase (glutamine-hydrolysing)
VQKAIAITHVEFEDLGSLRTALERANYAVELVNACVTDLRAVDLRSDLLIVLGGPIGVYEDEAYPFLKTEIGLIRSRLAERQPVVGICLGAQLIAAAAGASVHPGTRGKEIGWAPIHSGHDAALHPEFAPLLTDGLRVLHWHGDTFDLPAGAHHLAGTDAYANQAFAIGRHALGLQFHPEVTAAGLERWYVGHACELASAGISVPKLRQESERFAPALEDAGQRFWGEWLSLVSGC